MAGSPKLRRVVYASHVPIRRTAVLPQTLQDILVHATERNRREGLSGLLLCDGRRFIQALEGPAPAVEACMQRIVTDDRHEHLSVRIDDDVSQRLFGRWSMCGLTLSPADDAVLHPAEIGFDLGKAGPGLLLQMLCGVAERHAPELDALHERLTSRAAVSGRPGA